MIFVQPRPPTLSRLTPAVVLSQSDWALTPEDCNVCVRRYEGRTALIVIYLVIVGLIQVMIVSFYPDTWSHLVTLQHWDYQHTVYFTELCLCYVHPLMYHPNFDIKGLIINSLKLSQNLNIYFIQDQHWILNLFLIILDSHNHLLQSTLCYNHSLQTVTTTKKQIM